MRVIKFFAWEDRFVARLRELREKELVELRCVHLNLDSN
jgi:hypothetical protein